MNLERLFSFDQWGNREVVARLREMTRPPAEGVRIFAHIVGTQWLWYERLTGTPSKMKVWPDLSVDAVATEIVALQKIWAAYLPKAPMSSSITYKNSKGESWASTVEDVLMHITIHGAYHRGQIATAVRAAGGQPPYTDYIQATRTNAV